MIDDLPIIDFINIVITKGQINNKFYYLAKVYFESNRNFKLLKCRIKNIELDNFKEEKHKTENQRYVVCFMTLYDIENNKCSGDLKGLEEELKNFKHTSIEKVDEYTIRVLDGLWYNINYKLE